MVLIERIQFLNPRFTLSPELFVDSETCLENLRGIFEEFFLFIRINL